MILVLGGTTEGRHLAEALVAHGIPHVLSLAGRTNSRAGAHTRVGGFGGVDGLAAHLREHGVTGVVDATHPFAARMHANAHAACARTGTPLLRLARPGWASHPDAARWHWVDGHDEALAALAPEARVLLTVGRQEAARYAPHPGPVVVRVAQASDGWRATVPERWEVLEARGPFELDAERALLARVDVLVTKDSGGSFNEAKLLAARELGTRVVMVRRPAAPPVDECARVGEAVAWALAHSSSSPAT